MNHNHPCPYCGGSGRVYDNRAVGAALRAKRSAMGFKLYYVAKQMGLTSSHLSMLEAGKRRWTPQRINSYKKALQA